jgi:methylthioribose-1-phosphate isomerase
LSDNLPAARALRSVDWVDGAVVIVDQTRLPSELHWLHVTEVAELVDAIKRLAVRGAPSIGVAGAFGVALAASRHDPASSREAFDADVRALRTARPTAVNLARSVDRANSARAGGASAILTEALAIRDEEIAACWSMGEYGADLLIELIGERPQRLMTICNTGGLAAVERGTALGVIQTMFERGLLIEAMPTETRPLLQGSRLTTWELERMGAPYRLSVDSAGPFLLARGGIDAVLVGADRIAVNGDTANKVGTYALALGASRAGVPFIVVAPESTIDMDTAEGGMIEIEDRGPAEVVRFHEVPVAPSGTDVTNPAFDITPHDLITAIVTDRRVVRLDRGEKLYKVAPGPRRGSLPPTTIIRSNQKEKEKE